MQESTTYQAILSEGRSEGRVAGEQRFLILQGTQRFGKPDAATLAAIEAIRDFERLELMCGRVTDSDLRDWSGLLRTP
jgi:hypothetical protein